MLKRANHTDRPLRVAVLCSQRAPGLESVLRAHAERSGSWELVVCLSTDPDCRESGPLAAAGVPLIVNDIRAFYAAADAPLSDLAVRRTYDRRSLALLARYEPDLLVLSGYLYVVTEPVLTAYPSRVVNLHHSDLAVHDPTGERRYRGLRAVRDALFAGALETRSTAHIATAEIDGGPPLVRSWPFECHPLVQVAREWGADDILKAYAYAHREWMMRACWGTLITAVAELFADGRVDVRDGTAFVNGRPGPIELETPSSGTLLGRPPALHLVSGG